MIRPDADHPFLDPDPKIPGRCGQLMTVYTNFISRCTQLEGHRGKHIWSSDGEPDVEVIECPTCRGEGEIPVPDDE